MTSADADAFARFVQQRRVRCETERPHLDGLPAPSAAEYVVRLFALHDKAPHRVPGCPSCRDLARELRRLAETALAAEDLGAAVDIGPLPPVLYDSRVVPGRDEVALPVRLRSRADAGPAQPGDDRPVREACRRLKGLGVEGG